MAVKRYSGTSWVTEAGAAAPLPSGMLAPFAGASAPTGWLLCTGGTFSATAFPQLAAALGDTYGVHSGDNYYLPDLRGRTIAGLDNMGGTDAGRLDIANTAGTVTGSQYFSVPSHTHTMQDHQHASPHGVNPNANGASGSIGAPWNTAVYGMGPQATFPNYQAVGAGVGSSATGYTYLTSTINGGAGQTSTPNSGVDTSNMQPTIVMNYIIKT